MLTEKQGRTLSAVDKNQEREGYLELLTSKIMGFGNKKSSIVSETRALEKKKHLPLRSLDLRRQLRLSSGKQEN